MTTYFISRHPGTRDWAEAEGFRIDRWVEHLDPALLQPGDRVLGTLPVHLAAAVCARGARYYHLALDLPGDWRGRELTAAELREHGARLEPYVVTALTAAAAETTG